MTTLDDLKARAQALKLYGLLAHWDDVKSSDWLVPLIEWEEAERQARSLQRRLSNARLGQFKSLTDFDWQWPKHCDRAAIEELMRLASSRRQVTRYWWAPTGSANPLLPAISPTRRSLRDTLCCLPLPARCSMNWPPRTGTVLCGAG